MKLSQIQTPAGGSTSGPSRGAIRSVRSILPAAGAFSLSCAQLPGLHVVTAGFASLAALTPRAGSFLSRGKREANKRVRRADRQYK